MSATSAQGQRPPSGQGVPSPHGELTISLECTACHTTEGWSPARSDMEFDHDVTSFPLEGMHGQTQCVACHLDFRFDQPKTDPVECASCHFDVHLDAFAQPCVACHTTESFRELQTLEVHARTNFPLTGAHLQVTCEACHQDEERGAFGQLDGSCIACHENAYVAAVEIDHDALGFSQDCTECHTTLAWSAIADFEHVTFARGFDLVGAHASIDCTDCHVIPGLETFHSPTSQDDCLACHQVDYDSEHGGDGYPTECLTCHTTQDWGAQFDHTAISLGFELQGAHRATPCTTCHTLPDMQSIFSAADAGDCIACHQPDYDREHAGSGIGTNCLDCHTVDAFQDPDFDHVVVSGGFALVDPHETLLCSSCHLSGNRELKFPPPSGQNDCVACHQADYEAQHAGSGFSSNCLDCHTATTWQGAAFNHAQSTGFALVGAHQPLDCAACHVPGSNALRFPAPSGQNDCVACHQSDYDAQHQGSGFSTNCLDCHTASTWSGANFDHASAANGFRLLDPHDQQPCSACHTQPGNGLLINPQNDQDCIACHQSDFNNEHGGDQYPTTCLTCHAANTWSGAQFNHNAFFPIYTGAHKPEIWGTCSTCHVNPADFMVFTCLTCHEHRQTQTDADHSEVSGYVYQSQVCYNCHTNGQS